MKLLPCPYCGDDVSIQNVIGKMSDAEDWITCDTCFKCFIFADNEGKGIALWNRRVYPAEIMAVLDAAGALTINSGETLMVKVDKIYIAYRAYQEMEKENV